MIFSEKIKNLVQKLQKSTLLVLLSVFFIFPISGLFANEADLPVIIPNDELLTPIELRDGLVLEVVVTEERELAFDAIPTSEIQTAAAFVSSDASAQELTHLGILPNAETVSLNSNGSFSQMEDKVILEEAFVFENSPEHFSVKSIASPGLFGFLGICLSRSELPSKNFSMLCESSLPKSMTRRSANDWKFLWQPVRTTSLWPLSTNSSKMLRTSTPRPSRNHTHSMSDISSTWSNATVGFPVTFWQEKRTDLLRTAQALSLLESNPAVALKPNVLHPNPQVL